MARDLTAGYASLSQRASHSAGLGNNSRRTFDTKYKEDVNVVVKYLLLILIVGATAGVANGQRSSHFRVTVDSHDAAYVLDLFERNRAEILQRVSSAGIETRFPNLEIVFNATTGDFTGRTGMPPWAAATTSKNKIELQPLTLLKQRRILETTVRHELVHVLIEMLGGGQTPRWLTEGMALYLAGEGGILDHYQPKSMSISVVEQSLATAKSADEMKSAYAAAYKLVKELIRVEGENKIWKRLADRGFSGKIIPAPDVYSHVRLDAHECY